MGKTSRKGNIVGKVIACEAVLLAILLVIFAIRSVGGGIAGDESGGSGKGDDNSKVASVTPEATPTPAISEEELQRIREAEEKKQREEMINTSIAEADRLAAMYDYDAASELLRKIENSESETAITDKLAEYQTLKSQCVVWPDNTQISHLFVHSLIVDTDRAFGAGSSQPVGYNRYMTTVYEFNRMLEQMYERGYVLVSIHDIAKMTEQEDGTTKLVAQEILLPEGKIPFVLSQDDVNYYGYMEGDGFAERLVIGEDGKPTCEYIDADGNVLYGEYDVLPIVDRFLEEHPDFSYRGAKGILAVTGYEGALGYDTAWHLYDLENEDERKKLEEQQELAKAVADAIKEDGWEFASHSFTHTSMTTNSIDKVIYDTDRWKAQVELLLGETDIYIYPFGADICDWRGYSGEKYEYLKKAGFNYFCNVDSARYWIQIRDDYMRMGRINADGERMYYAPEKLEYFFDVDSVFDPARPTPVNG